jgi:hypothetical protein
MRVGIRRGRRCTGILMNRRRLDIMWMTTRRRWMLNKVGVERWSGCLISWWRIIICIWYIPVDIV